MILYDGAMARAEELLRYRPELDGLLSLTVSPISIN